MQLRQFVLVLLVFCVLVRSGTAEQKTASESKKISADENKAAKKSTKAGSNLKPIPALNTKGQRFKTLGATDYKMYPKALGELSAILVFVDFPEHKGKEPTADVAKRYTGDGAALKWFERQSYGP